MSLTTSPREGLLTEPRGGTNGFANGKHRPARSARPQRSLFPWIVALVVLLAAGGAVAWYLLNARAASGAGQGLTFEVASGPMVVSVTESGTIKAAEQEVLRAEVEGRTTIITLVPEGSLVKKGDLLVELDISAMEDERLEDTIEVQNAEAEFIRAREDLEVAKNQALADVAQAKLDYQFAIEDLDKYKLGEYPNLETEAKSKIEIAKEELTRAEEKHRGSQELFEQEFISRTELQADELALNKAKLELMLADQALKLLQDWEYKRQIAQLESDVEQMRLALERAERKASADVVQAEAELKARQSQLEREKDQLERVTAQIAKAKIYAPRDGLVVYATSAQGGGFRGNQEPLQEGQEVRERQELIYLPTATQMIAEIKIHESSLEKVRLDMPVRITVDALPGKSYRGKVTKIAPLPDANSMWMNPDLKVYNTVITVTGNGEELRTGMSCRAEIIVENYDETVYVPVQSIVRVSGVPTAFVVGDDGVARQREVEIGQDNNRMVVIKSGLEPGEKVLLAPPLGDTGTVETLRPEELTEEEKQQAEEAKDNPGVEPAPDGAVPMEGGAPGQGMMPGGQNGQAMQGGQNPAAEGAMRAMSQLREKATPEEQAKLREFFQNQDMAGGQAYLKELGEKYGIDTSAMSGMGGGGRRPAGGEGERDAGPGGVGRERGGNRSGGDAGGGRGDRSGRGGGDPDDDDAAPAPAAESKPAEAQSAE